MINLANLNIGAVYIGGTPISSIYAGDKLVYSANKMNGFITLTSKEDGNEIRLTSGINLGVSLVYSTDGKTWTPLIMNYSPGVTINKDESVYIGCTPGHTNETFYFNGVGGYNLTSTKAFDLSGNIMYLQSQTDIDEIKSSYEFGYLFTSSHVNDASGLILPARTTKYACYEGMFSNSDITQGPRINVVTTDQRDMRYMFNGCSNLTSINLPYLKDWGNECTTDWVSGVAASGTFYCDAELPEEYGDSRIPTGWNRVASNYLTFTSKADGNAIGMTCEISTSKLEFHLVYSTDKTTWNEFVPGTTTVALNNGERMYLKCAEGYSNASFAYWKFTSTGAFDVAGNIMYLQSLTDIDTLMSDHEFYYLFRGSKVKDASKLILSAQTLTKSCYGFMFEGSTITDGPSIEAVTFGDSSMDMMFCNCSNIKTIMLPNATDWQYTTDATMPTGTWVFNVPSTGKFYCNAELPERYDSNHIPTGWTRITI